ncbi:hypothetical protein HanPSC8_Chr05g0193001 [Helianthus annuus]|nr:hypothetical protein HanPSC8_Chr05g0193001 [Helianthus annuus]
MAWFIVIIFFRVNYKFCPLCLHQISGAVLFAKSLQAVSFTFQNLARFVL